MAKDPSERAKKVNRKTGASETGKKPSGRTVSREQGQPELRKEKPEIRIRQAADRLFYSEGFDATGINRVLEEAGAHKQSLYSHFESKEDLGRAYVEERGRQVAQLLRTLTGRPDPVSMVRSWVGILKREARKESFYGCPLANFSSQTLSHGNRFQPLLNELLNDWMEILADYFRRWADSTGTDKSARKLARQLLMVYEGNTQLFLITRDPSWLDRISDDFEDLLCL